MNIKGKIFIEVRDEATGDVIRTQEHDNVITVGMEINEYIGPDGNTGWGLYSGTSYPQPGKIHASARQLAPNNKTIGYQGWGLDYPNTTAGFPTSDYERITPSQRVDDWLWFDGNPPYFECRFRFNSPPTVRTINSIFTSPYYSSSSNIGSYSEHTATAIALTTPCIQNPGEVLDITYRIQFFEQTTSVGQDIFISDDFFRDAYIATRKFASRESMFPSYPQGFLTKVPQNTADNDLSKIVVGNFGPERYRLYGTGTSYSGLYAYDHFKTVMRSVLEKDDLRGAVIRGVSYGSEYYGNFFNDVGAFTSGRPETYPAAEMMSPFVGDDFAFKPIQPIQNHNKDAVEWGLDVDFLASSQGSIDVDGSGWTNPDWPEFWRVEFSKTGEVGTANYFFRNRRINGLYQNTYQPIDTRVVSDHISAQHPTRSTAKNPHGLYEFNRNEEYGADSYVSWDETGINIHLLNETKIISYDENSVPPLPVTGLKQVAVLDSGDIWLACRNTGLYRLTNPLNKNAASVTKMTEANNGLFTGSGNTCYAVAPGAGDSVWAVLDGALSKSTNPSDATPTFTNYEPTSATPFEYDGLTNGNWSKTKYMRVDRNTPVEEMAIMYNAGNTEQIVWWSTDGVSFEGPLSGNFFSSSYDHTSGNQMGSVDVSKRGNLWAWIGPNFSDVVEALNWGSTTRNDLTYAASSGHSKPAFGYDYYGVPYICNASSSYFEGTSTSTSGRNGPGVMSVDRQTFTYSPRINYGAPMFMWQNSRASGLFTAGASGFQTSSYKNGGDPKKLCSVGTASSNSQMYDSLNAQHSPMEEMVWDKYHWDGTGWEIDYYVDAVDTAGFTSGPYPAKRHNFDTESHYFTGRSMLDVTSVFAANNFGTTADATFVFSLRPDQKEDSSDIGTYHNRRIKKQIPQTTLFEIADKNNRLKVMWKEHNNNQSISVKENNGVETNIAPTPANIATGFYRFVVSISGNQLSVYLDGNQLGSTVTLQGTYDWSNTDDELKAYISSRVYKREGGPIQFHTPWPEEMFKGEMQNIQIWNAAWDATDVTNDFANINGVITSKPAANLVARYELTESLEGTETKTTHTTPELLDEGITISFADGTNPDSFVATDYYTFGVVDGILKDNSMSLTRSIPIYHKPVDFEFSEFTDTAGNSQVPTGSTNEQITEKAVFTKSDETLSNLDSSSRPTTSNHKLMDFYPGKIWRNDTAPFSTQWTYFYVNGAKIAQHLTADGYIEARPAAADTHVLFGFTDQPNEAFRNNLAVTGSNNMLTMKFAMEIRPNGTISIRESGTVVASNIANYTLTDRFKIVRTSTTITYHIIDQADVDTVIYTSTTSSTGDITGGAIFPHEGTGLVDVVVSYTLYPNAMRIGTEASTTGWYSDNWLRAVGDDDTSVSLQLDGIDATVTLVRYDILSNSMNPDPLEIIVDSKTGYMFFNAADAGKTVTGTVSVIYDKN